MSRILRRVRQAGVYFVTSHTWQRRELFRRPAPSDAFLEQILDCRDRGFYKLHAFVLMPDHFHALLTPGEDASLERAMQMIKGGSAFRIRKQLLYNFAVWQSGFHDRWVRDAREYSAFLDYINRNPVKARLTERVQDYCWSSANRNYPMDRSQFDALGNQNHHFSG